MPAPRSSGAAAAATAASEVRRPVVVGRARRAHRAGHDERRRAGVEQVEEERGLLDRVGALDEDGAVDRSGPRAPSRIADHSSNSAGNVKWLAGVRPRSIGTTSAISSRPGTWARISAPDEGRDVAAGDRVVAHADRPAGEHDRDPGHGQPSRGPDRRCRPRCDRVVGRDRSPVAVPSPTIWPSAANGPGGRDGLAAGDGGRAAGAVSSSSSMSNAPSGISAPSAVASGSRPWTSARSARLRRREVAADAGSRRRRRRRPGARRAGRRPSFRSTRRSRPTMRIGAKLATDTSMFRTPNTRPRTSSGRSSWSCVWDGIATKPYAMPAKNANPTTSRQQRRHGGIVREPGRRGRVADEVADLARAGDRREEDAERDRGRPR